MADSKLNGTPDVQVNYFRLYSTSACHLCEEALAILVDLHAQMLALAKSHKLALDGDKVFVVEELDIADHDELLESFGTRIPVLVSPEDNAELAWPFDIQQAYEFIAPRLVFNYSSLNFTQ